MSSNWHKLMIQIPFASAHHAQIAKQTIDIDPELNSDAVKRTLEVDGDVLTATFQTLTIRLARLTANAYLENVHLIVRTLEHFGEDIK